MGSALAYKDMVELIDPHRVKPIIAGTFPLADANAAYRAATWGKLFGKAVIDFARQGYRPNVRRMCPATAPASSSSAKCPVSSMWTSAFGRSAL